MEEIQDTTSPAACWTYVNHQQSLYMALHMLLCNTFVMYDSTVLSPPALIYVSAATHVGICQKCTIWNGTHIQ